MKIKWLNSKEVEQTEEWGIDSKLSIFRDKMQADFDSRKLVLEEQKKQAFRRLDEMEENTLKEVQDEWSRKERLLLQENQEQKISLQKELSLCSAQLKDVSAFKDLIDKAITKLCSVDGSGEVRLD